MTDVSTQLPSKHLIIMGIRGVPASHGGFETFAERLALYLVDLGWKVTVYCQGSSTGVRETDVWQGIDRIHIPIKCKASIGTIEFDIKATYDVLGVPGTILTLGYNTGFLCVFLALLGRKNYINMDGLEWKRAKYGLSERVYLWINERLAIWSGTHLIADHPAIADHLATRISQNKIITIPYGAPAVTQSDPSLLDYYGVQPHRYMTVIARAEPENSILEIVQGFSQKWRPFKLLVLGNYSRDHEYQRKVLDAASAQVIFPGPVYEATRVQALRFFSIAYIHGHQVGGTNPSLVEALGAGNAVVAHDNPFNRWVAGDAGVYFHDEVGICALFDAFAKDETLQPQLSNAARQRWSETFTWPDILNAYREVLESGS